MGGNLLSDGTRAFAYNVDNQLVGVSNGSVGVIYDYGPTDRLASRTVNGQTTRYFYDGSQVLQVAAPEPGSVALWCLMGLAAVLFYRRRSRRG